MSYKQLVGQLILHRCVMISGKNNNYCTSRKTKSYGGNVSTHVKTAIKQDGAQRK